MLGMLGTHKTPKLKGSYSELVDSLIPEPALLPMMLYCQRHHDGDADDNKKHHGQLDDVISLRLDL